MKLERRRGADDRSRARSAVGEAPTLHGAVLYAFCLQGRKSGDMVRPRDGRTMPAGNNK